MHGIIFCQGALVVICVWHWCRIVWTGGYLFRFVAFCDSLRTLFMSSRFGDMQGFRVEQGRCGSIAAARKYQPIGN